jgi:eukaryotic-like serine/threonine-protein kinase
MKAVPRVPGYELIACLGGGMLTSVYSARALADDSPCAVKLLRPDWAEDSTAVKLLQREARACLAAQHAHLVRLRQAYVTRPPYFLVMDLLAGESLRRRLRRDYHLNVPTALWVARQTAEALAALHRAGFVHGDVKPDNIRIVVEGHAILLDLGFAHHPGENADLLGDGYVLGTVNYLAPELCRPSAPARKDLARKDVDGFAADLFSLGVTMYEMLTGQLPYPAGSLDKTMLRHEADPPQEIGKLAPALPPPLGELVHALLARRPQDRPRAVQVVRRLVPLEIAAIRRFKAA